MDHEAVWTANALRDLEAVVAQVATEDPRAAVQVGEELIHHVEILHSFPRIGPIYRRAQSPGVRHIISGDYHIFYAVVASPPVVNILHVWHGARQDPDI